MLGRGGFGEVRLGVHKKTKKKVAIKFTNPSAYGNASNMAGIWLEAENIKKLNHKNIIKVECTFMMNHKMIQVMEYCEGGELLEYVSKKGHLTEDEARPILK